MIGPAKIHDKNIDQLIFQMADMVEGDDVAIVLRGLPVGNGGCGVPIHQCRLEAAATISRARTHKFISSSYPWRLFIDMMYGGT